MAAVDNTIKINVQVDWDPEYLQSLVVRFNQEIIGLPPRDHAGLLSPARQEFRMGHLKEEDDEVEKAYLEGNLEEVVDGLIDSIYVRLGMLYEMGVNPGPTFREVHEANMRRVRGDNPRRQTPEGTPTFDAVKPQGWVGPDNSWILGASRQTVELGEIAAQRDIDAPTLEAISPVFIHVSKIRAGKGRDYNTSVELHDYFRVWGHKGYHQMVQLKTLREQSLIELMDRGKVPNYEGLLDTIYDQLNYACFWAEAITEDRLPIAGSRGAEANGAVATKV